MSDFVKKGTIKRTIKYTTRDGEEKNRYVTVGEFWSTDGGNRRAVKIYATLNTDEQWLNIYPLEDDRQTFDKQEYKDTHEINKAQTDTTFDIDENPIDLSAIDF